MNEIQIRKDTATAKRQANYSPRNRTIHCNLIEINELTQSLTKISHRVDIERIIDTIINQDIFEIQHFFPKNFADLIILDPPYNLTKNYNGSRFNKMTENNYLKWISEILHMCRDALSDRGTLYVCSDWKTSITIAPLLEKMFCVHNRITWERGKGRGAKMNWKNNTEDIWFCTKRSDYYFNLDAVKIKKKVIAPYRENGKPKDWHTENGENYRLTHPSNIWADITIPFWSMPENTHHPTQKPEKLFAKLILASTKVGDIVFDPFAGSGTTAVVAKKLNRHFVCVEIDTEYCCWGQKRLIHTTDTSIQGYVGGVFLDRNSQLSHSAQRVL